VIVSIKEEHTMEKEELFKKLKENKNLSFYSYSRYISGSGYTSDLPKNRTIYMHEMTLITHNFWEFTKDMIESLYVSHDFSSSGDYGGSLVELSNCSILTENYHHLLVIGGYSSSYATVSLSYLIENLDTGITEEIIDIYDSLNDYPVIDDEIWSQLEDKYASETWEACYKDEFIDLINKKFTTSTEPELTLTLGKDLESLRNMLMERSNTNWCNEEGYTMYLDIDRIINSMTKADFNEYFIITGTELCN
jgi:hypothetical protein